MITSEIAEADEQKPELSEDSEEEILQMVEEQLDRPNPPDTKVLYRRAMHFIDRDVRHLSLQQFNAKFPLQVKRRRARAGEETGPGAPEGTRTNGHSESSTESPAGDHQVAAARSSSGSEVTRRDADRADRVGEKDQSDPSARAHRRKRIRSVLLDYAKLVVGAETRAELVEAVPQVDEYVDRVMAET